MRQRKYFQLHVTTSLKTNWSEWIQRSCARKLLLCKHPFSQNISQVSLQPSEHIKARRHFFNMFFDVISDDLYFVALYYNSENLLTSYI